jgi:hypothetical protein
MATNPELLLTFWADTPDEHCPAFSGLQKNLAENWTSEAGEKILIPDLSTQKSIEG